MLEVTVKRTAMNKHGSGKRKRLLLPLMMLPVLLLASIIYPSNAFSSSNVNPSSPSPSSNNSNNNSSKNSQKHISSAQRFRYEEEQRRVARRNENIPGKTSAIPNAQNLPINISQTQNEWYNQATDIEKQIKEYSSQGLTYLKGLELEKANDAFDKVFELKPNTYCWQAGIVKFYLKEYYEAAQCFANCAEVYESKFGMIASEERIWRDACELKIRHLGLSSSSSRNKNSNGKNHLDGNQDGREQSICVPQMRQSDDDISYFSKESRKVVRIARDLFSSSIQHDLSTEALARGKLRSICGEYDSSSSKEIVSPFKTDKKMWRLNSWFYLGLHYDVLDDKDNSKDCMKMALRQCASTFGNGDDIIQTLPMLHMARRDWFDDDEFLEDDGDGIEDINIGNFDQVRVVENRPESNFLNSIQDSVESMKLSELQASLKKKGLKSSGSKSVLKDRLLRSILDQSDFGG